VNEGDQFRLAERLYPLTHFRHPPDLPGAIDLWTLSGYKMDSALRASQPTLRFNNIRYDW
jgi:hypothetical protein